MASRRRWSPLFSSFWTLQSIGWGTYGLLWYLASLPIYDAVDAPAIVGAVRTLFYVGLGLSLTVAFRPLYRWFWNRESSLPTLLVVSSVCSLVGSALWLVVFEAVKWPLDAPPFSGAYRADSVWYFARPMLGATIVLLAWSALYFEVKYQRNLLAQQERTLRAKTLAREAQLQVLRSQLNPHFLFNTLNTLLSLIGEDDQRAKRFVHELADLLRYSLLNTDTNTVSLQEEIEVIRSFLSIERLRFDDRFQVHYNVDPETESVQVPPFLIQSLVENAVKHGRRTPTSPLTIRLTTRQDHNTLHVEVENTGQLRAVPPLGSRGGIGLKNLRERLDRLYPETNSFTLEEQNGWVRAHVAIPHPAGEPRDPMHTVAQV